MAGDSMARGGFSGAHDAGSSSAGESSHSPAAPAYLTERELADVFGGRSTTSPPADVEQDTE